MSSETGGETGRDGAVLRPGDTCWRIERAARLAVIVDAADYFRTIRTAIRQARHSIFLIV